MTGVLQETLKDLPILVVTTRGRETAVTDRVRLADFLPPYLAEAKELLQAASGAESRWMRWSPPR